MLDGINWSAMKFWLDLLSTLALFILFIWTLIKQKQKDNSDDIKTLSDQHLKLDQRVQKLENTQDLQATHKDVTEIRVDVSGLSEKVDGMDRKLDLIQEVLLKKD